MRRRRAARARTSTSRAPGCSTRCATDRRRAFFEVTRRLVYGRPDPKPGNFQPRFASTSEYIGDVNQVTGKDMSWFFDVYLRQAALPELIETRDGDTLTLRWKTPGRQALPAPGRSVRSTARCRLWRCPAAPQRSACPPARTSSSIRRHASSSAPKRWRNIRHSWRTAASKLAACRAKRFVPA